MHPGEHQLAWDVGCVTLGGLGLMLAGYLLGRTGRRAEAPGHPGALSASVFGAR